MNGQPEMPGLSASALRALREDQPSQRELAAAYQRFARRSQRRAPGLVVSRWLLAGLAMGLSVAFGAEAIVQRIEAPRAAARPAAVPSVVAKTPQNRGSAPLAGPTPVDDPPASVVEEKMPAPTGALAPRAPAFTPSPTVPVDSAAWTKAAEGLRTHDVAQTESALATLEQASNLADREAARLIRAQLMLHQGDVGGARVLLQDLANHAQSSLVRAKASRLLAQHTSQSNSPLNTAPSGT